MLLTAAALTAAGDSRFDPATGAPVLAPVADPLSNQAQEEFKSLQGRFGTGVQVVECAPGLAKLPAGIQPSRALGFSESHPAFTVLSDGHCAMDTSRPGTIVAPDPVD